MPKYSDRKKGCPQAALSDYSAFKISSCRLRRRSSRKQASPQSRLRRHCQDHQGSRSRPCHRTCKSRCRCWRWGGRVAFSYKQPSTTKLPRTVVNGGIWIEFHKLRIGASRARAVVTTTHAAIVVGCHEPSSTVAAGSSCKPSLVQPLYTHAKLKSQGSVKLSAVGSAQPTGKFAKGAAQRYWPSAFGDG